LGDPVYLAAGGAHTCAVFGGEDADYGGQVQCWGSLNLLGSGSGSTDSTEWDAPAPVSVRWDDPDDCGSDSPLLVDVLRLAAGSAHTCALLGYGQTWCWGENGSGQLGIGTTATMSKPALCATVLVEDCGDGADNDGDTLPDCDDTDCASDLACGPSESDCGDGTSNDTDGLVDCLDSDCASDSLCVKGETCDNGGDDDGDGAEDCCDKECTSHAACGTTECCDNGVNDDADTDVDCCDDDCDGDSACGS
jgi:hypothetical protein